MYDRLLFNEKPLILRGKRSDCASARPDGERSTMACQLPSRQARVCGPVDDGRLGFVDTKPPALKSEAASSSRKQP